MDSSPPRHKLHIKSAQTGAVFRVTDGRSAKVGSGMYRLDLELPQGLYSVSAMMGASTESKTVLLDQDRQVTLSAKQPSFGDLAFAVMGQIQAEVGAMQFDAGGTPIVTVRGPFAATPSRKHKVQVKAGGVLIKAVVDKVFTEDAGHFWLWQLFHVSAPGPITVMREVNGEKFSHTVPRFGAWTIWAAYPAPPEVAHPEVTLPNPFYARMRLTQSGNAPDLGLQSLSDQVFTALASRTALPLSKPVLDVLFGDGADPLLALAAAHLISLKLCRYGRLKWLPQDRVRSAPPSGEDANEERLTEEPVSLDEIHECVRTWLMAPRTEAIADCPDMIAVRHLYKMNTDFDDDFGLEKPPVLLRSFDALFDVEHTATESHRKFSLHDSVWKAQFQISDAFALLQWHTDSKKSKSKRLDQLKQSFVMSKALERALEHLHDTDEVESTPAASTFRVPIIGEDMMTTLQAPMSIAIEALSNESILQSEKVTTALNQIDNIDFPQATRIMDSESEFKNYLEDNAQALRLPSTAIKGLTGQMLRQARKETTAAASLVDPPLDISLAQKEITF